MIPKIIHQIWLGPAKRPHRCMDSWKALHPDWEYKLWTDQDLDQLRQFGTKFAMEPMYYRSNNYQMMSDVLRLEILYNFGGWFIDADAFALRPLDSLLEEHPVPFIAVRHPPPPPHSKEPKLNMVINGILGAEVSHPLLFQLMEEVVDADRFLPPHLVTGPHALDPLIRAYSEPPVTVLEHQTFLPFHWDDVELLKQAASVLLQSKTSPGWLQQFSWYPLVRDSYSIQFWQRTQRDYANRGDQSRWGLIERIR